MGRIGHPSRALQPWRLPVVEAKENGLENGLSDSAVTPDEPKSEPLPETASLLPAGDGLKKSGLHRQQSLIILTGTAGLTDSQHRHISLCFLFNYCLLTEPELDKDLPISTVKTQEILQGNVVRESAEGHGTIEWVSTCLHLLHGSLWNVVKSAQQPPSASLQRALSFSTESNAWLISKQLFIYSSLTNVICIVHTPSISGTADEMRCTNSQRIYFHMSSSHDA